ncbi:MAG: RNA polymerase sigma factor [Bacteroidales bacterium]
MNSNEFNNRIISLSPRIYPMVARLIGNEDEAADAVQEIMIRLWKSRAKLEKHPNPEGFAFLTARNYCMDLLKRRSPFLSDLSRVESVRTGTTGGEELEGDELLSIVNGIINELAVNQRDIVLMRDIDGLEFEEIAAVTGIKIENIRVLLSRARRKIGARLNEIYNYEYGTVR